MQHIATPHLLIEADADFCSQRAASPACPLAGDEILIDDYHSKADRHPLPAGHQRPGYQYTSGKLLVGNQDGPGEARTAVAGGRGAGEQKASHNDPNLFSSPAACNEGCSPPATRRIPTGLLGRILTRSRNDLVRTNGPRSGELVKAIQTAGWKLNRKISVPESSEVSSRKK